jgi:hypothetical protein
LTGEVETTPVINRLVECGEVEGDPEGRYYLREDIYKQRKHHQAHVLPPEGLVAHLHALRPATSKPSWPPSFLSQRSSGL